jgi:Uma2 family endonuclease
MSSQAVPKPATYDDLCRVPAPLVAELIGGQIYTQPRPRPRHAIAGNELFGQLLDPFRRGRGGPGGWIFLSEQELHLDGNVLVPDLAGWRRERLPEQFDAVGINVVPDWVCEVQSPSTTRTDRLLKLPLYARLGVPFLWLVHPAEQTIDAYVRAASGHWELRGSAVGDDPLQLPPFDAVPLELAALWRW